jgi:hypothetical protein
MSLLFTILRNSNQAFYITILLAFLGGEGCLLDYDAVYSGRSVPSLRVISPKDGGSEFLRNVDVHLPDCTES